MTYQPPDHDDVNFELEVFDVLEADEVDFNLAPPGTPGLVSASSSFSSDRSGQAFGTFAAGSSFTSDTAGSAQGAFTATSAFEHGPNGDSFGLISGAFEIAGRPVIPGVFALQAAYTSDRGGSAQADFAPALTAGVAAQQPTATTTPVAAALTATGDNEPLGTQQTSGIFLAQPAYSSIPVFVGVAGFELLPSGQAISATSDVAPVEWRVIINQEEVVQDVFDVEVIDTANPFGSHAIVYADDLTGTTFEKFRRGTRVDIAYSDNQGITFERRFTGYVVESREYDDAGSDTLEVECYTFDQFLRRSVVSDDLTGLNITQALASIIQNDTPVTFVPENVTVGSEKTLSRSYQGEPVEDVLRALSFASVNEEFGVNDEVEFFFRPRESEHNARGVDNTRWLNYDIPELGKDAVNEVRVFFDNGNRTVVVDDGNDQLNLQDSLELASAGRQIEEISRPDITTVKDAEDEGRRFLEQRSSILSGTVTTFGLYDLEPGDTINIEIKPRGIDDEFRVAEVRYHWGRSETHLTIVEKRGTNDDILFRISSSLKRIEVAGADRTAVEDKILKNDYRLLIAPIDNEGKFDDIKVTNTALNLLRDDVINETTITIAEVRWGDDSTNLSRTNTGLEGTQVAAFTAGSGNWVADTSVFNILGLSYESSETAGANEVGLFDNDGNMLIRAVSDQGVRANQIDWSISFDNDDTLERTVVTHTGQQLFRDILADNTPAFLQQYRVGEGDPDSAGFDILEEDTDLDDDFPGSLGKVDLDTLTIAGFDGEQDWLDGLDPIVFDSDYPIVGPVLGSGGSSYQMNLAQNGYWKEIEDATILGGQVANWSTPPDASEFQSLRASANGHGARTTFFMEIDHDPNETTMHVGAFLDDFDGTFEYFVNNKSVRQLTYSGSSSGSWSTGGSAFLDLRGISASELSEGSSVEVEVRITNYNSGAVFFDFLQLNDELDRKGIPRYRDLGGVYPPEYVLNAVGGLQSYNPVPVPFKQIQSPIQFNEITIEADVIGSAQFNDVDGEFTGPPTEFRILASNDGGSTFLESINDTNPTFTFAQGSTTLDLVVWLDGYWADTSDGSPAGASAGMDLNTLNVQVGIESLTKEGIGGVNARAIFRPQTITAGGDFVTEGGLFDTAGDMVCRTIAIAPFDPGTNVRVSTDDTITLVGA